MNTFFWRGNGEEGEISSLTSTSRLLTYYWPRREKKSVLYKSKLVTFGGDNAAGRSVAGEGLPASQETRAPLSPPLPRDSRPSTQPAPRPQRPMAAAPSRLREGSAGCRRPGRPVMRTEPSSACRLRLFVNTAEPWAAPGARPRRGAPALPAPPQCLLVREKRIRAKLR